MLTKEEVEKLKPSEHKHNSNEYFFNCNEACVSVYFSSMNSIPWVSIIDIDGLEAELPTINTLDKLVALLSLLERRD